MALTLILAWVPFATILALISAMETFIGFLQGFVYVMLLKIYSDDSLFTVVKAAYNSTKNFIVNLIYRLKEEA